MHGKVLGPTIAALALGLALPASAADLAAEQTVQAPGGWNVSASADFVYATREEGNNYVILQDTITGETLADSDDLNFGWEPGLDARLNFTNGLYGGGVRFFGGFDFDAANRLTTSPIFNFPTIPPLFGLGVANATVDYDSSLDTVELNVSRALGSRAAVFVGVRSVMLDETLKTRLDFGGVNTAFVTFEADTFAIGPQIGAEFHYGDRVFVDLDGRIGALVADADLSMNVSQNIGPAFAAMGDETDWIAVAEGGIAVGVMVGQSTSLRAGYRVLYLDGVTTAPSIVDKAEIIPATIRGSSEDILIHGVTLGLKTVF